LIDLLVGNARAWELAGGGALGVEMLGGIGIRSRKMTLESRKTIQIR
jgi:hypothetical protein